MVGYHRMAQGEFMLVVPYKPSDVLLTQRSAWAARRHDKWRFPCSGLRGCDMFSAVGVDDYMESTSDNQI